MKPVAFDYRAPRSLDEALELFAGSDGPATPLAGGYSLVPLMNQRRVRPRLVVDLNRVPDLADVRVTPDAVHVGAMARLHDLCTPTLRQALPILPEVVAYVAHPQVRRRGTLGGSLCHADPAAELPALAVALDARLHLLSVDGARSEAAGDFFRSAHRTSRRPHELLVAVEFPRLRDHRFRFEEASRRGGPGLPLVGVCAGLATAGGVVTGARVAVAGVGDRPLRLTATEEALLGRPPGGLRAVPATADLVARPTGRPADEAAYRHALLRTLLHRALDRLAATGDQGEAWTSR